MIDTNLIIGRLGSGKTTAIRHLLSNKPKHENWAIIVNEFGQIGIDAALLETATNENLNITEIAGGCICCAAQSQLRVTLTTLIRKFKPDRIIIEASGLGHPAGIIDLLRDQYFQPIININSIISFIDVTLFHTAFELQTESSPLKTESFSQQMQLADIIVLNKSDLAQASDFDHANKYFDSLYPRKKTILTAIRGKIDIKWLTLSTCHKYKTSSTIPTEPYHAESEFVNFKGIPIQTHQSETSEHLSFGFILPAEFIFNRRQIIDFTRSLMQDPAISIIRLKAVLNCRQLWYGFNAIDQEIEVTESCYRRDNRMEFITTNKQLNTEQLKNDFFNCIKRL